MTIGPFRPEIPEEIIDTREFVEKIGREIVAGDFFRDIFDRFSKFVFIIY